MSLWEGGVLFVLFMAQFLTPHSIVSRDVFTIMYFVAAGIFLVRQVIEMRPFARGVAVVQPHEVEGSLNGPS
jgi:hypothetical protein